MRHVDTPSRRLPSAGGDPSLDHRSCQMPQCLPPADHPALPSQHLPPPKLPTTSHPQILPPPRPTSRTPVDNHKRRDLELFTPVSHGQTAQDLAWYAYSGDGRRRSCASRRLRVLRAAGCGDWDWLAAPSLGYLIDHPDGQKPAGSLEREPVRAFGRSRRRGRRPRRCLWGGCGRTGQRSLPATGLPRGSRIAPRPRGAPKDVAAGRSATGRETAGREGPGRAGKGREGPGRAGGRAGELRGGEL
jgi:hypothetical protein